MTKISEISLMPLPYKVALVCHPYHFDKRTGRGHDRYSYEILKFLLRQDLDVKILHTGVSNSIYEASMKEIFFQLQVLQEDADLYHATNIVGAKSVAIAQKTPLVTTIHDMVPFHFGGVKHAYQRICTEIAVKKSEKLIVPYCVTQNEIVSRFEVSKEKIVVINYGVDHQFFFPRRVKKSSKKTVLYIGEISKFKGVDLLVNAFSLAIKKVKDAELLIGGKGKDLKKIERLVTRLKMDQKIRFLGFVPEERLPDYYSLADLSVFPSKLGFGLPTLEAMACGSPVIAGDSLDASEFVGDAGILIDPEDADQLGAAIVKVLTSDNPEALSKKSIEKSRLYSWEKVAERTIKVYKEVLSA
jgi:glycosyltransferase involved in cell wall biosynthesis